ncbi:MAG: choloylglycine hydrolase family protein [Candidatus Obscuribacterales bacterium]|nr:choloylglycine hydrolase family protein [Candidatus Obscuribacterales bacterium]
MRAFEGVFGKLPGVFLSLSLVSHLPAVACTDFQVKTKDNSVIIGRSMEWAVDLKSQLRVHARGEDHTSRTPDGKAALKWLSKYGYVAADALDIDVAIDGMNEKGLSVGALWLPEYTTYQTVAPKDNKITLDALDLGHWILGNFSTVAEVKANLPKVKVWCKPLEQLGGISTMHFALHDAKGNNAVLEFVDGQQKFYDNPNGVLTNAPPFDWQSINMRNYLTLKPANPTSIEVRGTVLAPPGQGSGFLGVPGDWTPPSRFVRTIAMVNFAKPVDKALDGVILAQHILNAVDIPVGDVRAKPGDLDHCDYTQWALIKDLANNVMYFRTYENQNLRSIDLKRLDLNAGLKVRMLPMSGGNPIEDVSKQVKWRFVPGREEPVEETTSETKPDKTKADKAKEPKAKPEPKKTVKAK